VPFTAYKEAYEQDQAAYEDLTTKADVFKDLSQSLPEGSEARRIYEGYANDLKAQADNLTQNGLTMSGRSALRNLKRRYSGEIGMLDRANEALKKERELRRQMSAKDPSMLYAVNPEELNIDQFLGGKTPSLYGVSGTELYTKAAAASQAASKRQFSVNGDSKTLGGYYYDYVQRMGYNPQTIAQFRRDMSSIPELQQAADDILMANGVTDNLSGRALEQARQQVINGMIDGAVYSEQHNPQRNLGVMTAAEQASDARSRESMAIQRANASRAQQQLELSALESGYKREGDNWVFDPEILKKRQESLGISGYNPEEWEIGPNGKPRKKTVNKSTQTPEEKKENSKQKELLKLDKGALAHNEGFDVQFGDDRHHYNYIGAISRHGDKWHHGAIGDDNPGHGGLRGWGFGSTSNVENIWGNFSAESSDSKEMRVLSPDEMIRLVSSDAELLDAIEKQAKAMNVDPETADIQLIEVPNEKGGGGNKGYLIAVH